MSEKPCGAYFFENFFVPILTSGGLAAVSSSAFAALYSAFGKYDVVHIHAEGPAFFAWLPKMFGKRVVVTVHGIDWQREKWQSGLGSKFIHQGEKNAAKYADEVIVLSKGVQDYFKETYGRETHFIPNGVNRPQIREASLITDKDKEVMGNLNNQTWDELWNSPEAEKVRAKVRCCDRDCWMIGSVSPAMHKYIWKPATWVLVHKFSSARAAAVGIIISLFAKLLILTGIT